MQLPKQITVATRHIVNFMEFSKERNGSYKFSGIEGRVLQMILKSLALPYEIITPEDDAYGVKRPDGNWTGLIGLLQRDEADMTMCILGQQLDMLEAVDFSNVYHIAFITFAMKKPKKLPRANEFLYAFTLTMWFSLIFVLMLFPIIYYFFLDKKYSIANLFLQMVASIIKQPIDFKIQSLKHRFVLGSWLVFSLIISFAYTQVLLSHSTLPAEGKIYRNFFQLFEAVNKGKIHSYLTDGSVFHGLFRDTPQSHIKILGEIIRKNQWYIERSVQPYMNIINEGNAVISGNFFPSFTYGDNLNDEIFVSDDCLQLAFVSLAFNKKFCCRQRINQIISRIWNSGLSRHYMNLESFQVSLKVKKPPDQNYKVSPIVAHNIHGVFLILLMGYLLSFLILLIEVIYFAMGKI